MRGSEEMERSSLSYSIVSPPVHGKVEHRGSWSEYVSYTPDPSFVGVDSFSFKASSEGQDSNIVTVTVVPNTAHDTRVRGRKGVAA